MHQKNNKYSSIGNNSVRKRTSVVKSTEKISPEQSKQNLVSIMSDIISMVYVAAKKVDEANHDAVDLSAVSQVDQLFTVTLAGNKYEEFVSGLNLGSLKSTIVQPESFKSSLEGRKSKLRDGGKYPHKALLLEFVKVINNTVINITRANGGREIFAPVLNAISISSIDNGIQGQMDTPDFKKPISMIAGLGINKEDISGNLIFEPAVTEKNEGGVIETETSLQSEQVEQEKRITVEESKQRLQQIMQAVILMAYNEVNKDAGLVKKLDKAFSSDKVFTNLDYKDLLGDTALLKQREPKAMANLLQAYSKLIELRDTKENPHKGTLYKFFADVSEVIRSLKCDKKFSQTLDFLKPEGVEFVKAVDDTPKKTARRLSFEGLKGAGVTLFGKLKVGEPVTDSAETLLLQSKENFERKLEEAENEHGGVKDVLNSRLIELQNQCEELNKQFTQKEREFTEVSSKVGNLEKDNENLTRELVELKKNTQTEINSLRKEKGGVEEARDKLKFDLEETTKKLNMSEEQRKSLAQQLQGKSEELAKEAAERKQEKEQLEASVSKLEREKKAVETKLEENEEIQNTLTTLNAQLTEKEKKTELQLKEKETELAKIREQLQEVDTLKRENEGLKQGLEAAKIKVKQPAITTDTTNGEELEFAQKQNKELLKEQESLKTQIKKLEEGAELLAKEEENAQLKHELEKLKQQSTGQVTSPVTPTPMLNGKEDVGTEEQKEALKGPSMLTNFARNFVCLSSAYAIGILAAPKLFDKGALRFGFEHVISREAVVGLNTALVGGLMSSMKGQDNSRDYKILVAGLATTVGLTVDAYFRGDKLSAVAAITTAAAAMCA
jgi:hypothetical protein